MAVTISPPQDLGEYKNEPANPAWEAIQPFALAVEPKRLEKPSQFVTLLNTGPQVHIVVDRYQAGHELRPGERKEIELLAEDIAYFIRERQPRFDNRGKLKPEHPIVVEGISKDAIEKAVTEWQERERTAAEAEAKKRAHEQLLGLLSGLPKDLLSAAASKNKSP